MHHFSPFNSPISWSKNYFSHGGSDPHSAPQSFLLKSDCKSQLAMTSNHVETPNSDRKLPGGGSIQQEHHHSSGSKEADSTKSMPFSGSSAHQTSSEDDEEDDQHTAASLKGTNSYSGDHEMMGQKLLDSTPSSSLATCLVCEDKSSGKHYGQYSCEGCKSFFKRSVRRNLVYSCRSNQNCTVDIQHRNQCQFCRFQKCVAVGMRRDSVQRGRVSNLSPMASLYNSYRHPWSKSESVSEFTCPNTDTFPSSFNNGPPPNAFLGYILKAQPFQMPNFSTLSQSSITLETLSDISCHLLAFVVNWAKQLPFFSTNLQLSDQMLLLKTSWHRLLLLMIAQSNLNLPVASLIASASLQTCSDQMMQNIEQIRSIQNQLEKMHRLYPTASEYACLRVVALFNPDIVQLQDPSTIENIQQRAHSTLEEHIKATQPHQPSRLGHLIIRLLPLYGLPQAGLEKMFLSQFTSVHKNTVDYFIGEWLFGSTNQLSPYSLIPRGPAPLQSPVSMNTNPPPLSGGSGSLVPTGAQSIYPPVNNHAANSQNFASPHHLYTTNGGNTNPWQPWGGGQSETFNDYKTFMGSHSFYNNSSRK